MIETVLGKYEIRGEIGRGAMGVVYRAWDTALEREVALKTMDVGGRIDAEESTVRFLREAKAAGRMRHPNIVTIYELGEESGAPFIAMELMEGTDLRGVLSGDALPPLDRRLAIVSDICRGLEFAHRAGIVHRDIKPANIFLLDDGSVKILDFGVAKLASSDATRTGTIIGSVEYMSPEQVRAERDLDGRSDVFAAGVILYELLFGRTPFGGEHVGAVLHRILHEPVPGERRYEEVLPPRLAGVLRRAMKKSREDRFASAGLMADALDAVAREIRGEKAESLASALEAAVGRGLLEADPNAGRASNFSPGAAAAPRGTRSGSRLPRALAAAALVAGVGLAVVVVMTRGGESDATTAETPPQVADASSSRGAGGIEPEEEPEAGPRADDTLEAPPAVASEIDDAAGGATVAVEPAPEDAQAGPARSPARDVAAGKPETVAETEPTVAGTRAPPPAVLDDPGTGRLSLVVTPWARVTSIQELGSERFLAAGQIAPAVLELPAGRYRVELVHPSSAFPLVVETSVEPDGRTTIRRTIATPDLMSWVRERLAAESYSLEDR